MEFDFKKIRDYIFLSLFFFLFIILSLIKEPWHDELYTNYITKKNPLKIISELKKDSGPPLYYLLIHFLTLPFGHSIFFQRFFSSIFIFLSGIFISKIFISVFGKKIPFYFFYLFPLSLYYSAEARNYSLIIFLSTLLFYELFTRRRIFYLTLFLTLTFYTHNLSFLFTGFLFFAFFFYRERKILYSILFSIFLYTPIFFFIKEQPKESIYWMSDQLKLQNFLNFFSNLGPNTFENYIYNFSPLFFPLIFSILNLIIIFYGLKEKKLKPFIYAFFLNFLFITLVSLFFINIYFPSRTEIFFFIPFIIFCFSFYLTNKRGAKILSFLYSITLIFSTLIILISLSKPFEFKREILEIVKILKPHTKVIVIGYWKLSLSYLIEKEGLKNEILTFPISQNEHPGWYYYEKLKEEDFNWFLENVVKSEEEILVLWTRGDPLAMEILEKIPEKFEIHNLLYFTFLIKNY